MAVKTSEQYLAHLQSLLPDGAAWSREPGAALTKTLLAYADGLARVDQRKAQLLDELDPRTTTEAIVDWERVTGLPDACMGQAPTLAERRARVLQQLRTAGGQSGPYYIEMAAALGFAITITEFGPFLAGHSCAGHSITNGPDWKNTWRVNAPAETIREFTAGNSVAGEPLRAWGNTVLECVIRRYKPGHTHVQFAYG